MTTKPNTKARYAGACREITMSDEWTWEDRQDTLDYRQWKAEQDAERANSSPYRQSIHNLLAAQEDFKARIARLEKENTLLRERVNEQEIMINTLIADIAFYERGE